MKLWSFSLTEDERTVLSTGLSSEVTAPLMDAPVGRFLVLFHSLAGALLYARSTVSIGMLPSGEFTFYEILGLPPGSLAQDVMVEYDEPSLEVVHIAAVSPPEIPAEYIRFAERRTIT